MSKESPRMSMKSVVTLFALSIAALLAAAPAASASQAILDFGVTTTSTQAGGHPDLGMYFELDAPGAPEAAKDVDVNTPPGVFGNPNAVVECSAEGFAFQTCPSESQVGLITVYANSGGNPNKLLGTAPIYSREPLGDQTALFGFIVPTLGVPVSIPVSVRTTTDYGLRFTVTNITQLTPVASAKMVFWGFPAEPANDDERFPKGVTGCPGAATPTCLGGPTPSGIFVRPLINNPSNCTGKPLDVSIAVTTYQDPVPSKGVDSYPATTGCSAMTFRPVLLATPTSKEGDSPAGLDLIMKAFQPLGRSTTPSPIRHGSLTLPEGLSINPDAADGQTACPDALANFGSEAPTQCPDSSKIGTFAVGVPALDGPLNGAIFIGEPQPGNQYRFFLVAEGHGINAKFIGTFRPDPITGQIHVTIENLPQAQFETFEVHLFASDRGLIATPPHCSIYPVVAHFIPWNDALPDQTSEQFFSIDSGPGGKPCPSQVRPFSPRLIAGSTNSTAGAFSDFNLQLDRDDGDQYLKDLNFAMPPGFTGSLRGISYCPEAALAVAANSSGRSEQATPSCPASSQVGTTNVSAGPGGHPFNVEGRIYLSGPLKGAPLSLAAITPALAGPYDYGTQVVRVAVNLDPETAQVRAVSDTVPHIIGGVPLRLRSIRVSLTRPNFLINPTSCDNFLIHTEGVGDQGSVTGFDSPFHAVNCFSLPFKPKMTVRQLGGRKATHRSTNPGLAIDLRTRPGDANLKSISVTLPKAFEIDQRHLGNICSEKELVQKECAGRTAIGTATTRTPLLDAPLSGPVYAVSGSGGLPRLAFILNGQVKLVPRADSRTVKDKLRTTVNVIPDAAVGHFHMKVFGGKTGYLINTQDICVRRPSIAVDFKGQNGKTRQERVKVKAACGKSKSASKRLNP